MLPRLHSDVDNIREGNLYVTCIKGFEKSDFKLIITASGCHDGNGGKNCCTTSNQCAEGEGGCDSHDQCQGDLKCGINTNNCNADLGFPSSYACCYDPNKGNFAIIILNKHGQSTLWSLSTSKMLKTKHHPIGMQCKANPKYASMP